MIATGLIHCPTLTLDSHLSVNPGPDVAPRSLQPIAPEQWLSQTHADPNLVFSNVASARFEEVVVLMAGEVLGTALRFCFAGDPSRLLDLRGNPGVSLPPSTAIASVETPGQHQESMQPLAKKPQT